ncbi:MAG: FRG domain-containing protein [Saccharofermentanales bacterium]
MKIDRNISCISDYLSIISEFSKSYTTQGYANIPGACKFLYRGISDKAYELIPAIFRKTNDIDMTINDFVENNRYTEYTTEKQILQSFIAEACAYIKNNPSKELYKWAEYAQHYGVPTRFLDWSENPLVALYFACKDNRPNYNKMDNIGGSDGTVWMLHLHNYRNFANQVNNIIYSNDQKNRYSISETINKIYQGEILIEYPMLYRPYYTDLRMTSIHLS